MKRALPPSRPPLRRPCLFLKLEMELFLRIWPASDNNRTGQYLMLLSYLAQFTGYRHTGCRHCMYTAKTGITIRKKHTVTSIHQLAHYVILNNIRVVIAIRVYI